MTIREQRSGFRWLGAVGVVLALGAGCAGKQTPEQLTSALLKASYDGNAREAKKLLALGADPNAANHQSGERPLRLAAVYGHLDCVKLLLEAGADPLLTARAAQPEARPLTSVMTALLTLEQAQAAQPQVRAENLAMQRALERGVSVQTYQEISRLLQAAEAQRVQARR